MKKQNFKMYELLPCLASNQSFYGKAKVIVLDDIHYLYSYDTEVAKIKDNVLLLNTSVSFDKLFSMTTLKHLRDFYLNETGKRDIFTKKQFIAYAKNHAYKGDLQ